MKTYLYLLFFLFFGIHSIFSQEKVVDQQLKDFSIFKNALLTNSAGLYYYSTEKEVENRFDSLEKVLKTPKSEIELFQLYSKFVASIRCGHSVVWSKKMTDEYLKSSNRLPFTIYYSNQKLFLAYEYKDSLITLPKYTEIVSLNNRKPIELANEISTYLSSDGFNQTLKNEKLKYQFMYLYYCFIEQADSFLVRYISEKKDTVSFNFKGSVSRIKQTHKSKSVFNFKRKNINYSIDILQKTAYLKLPYPLPNSLIYKFRLNRFFKMIDNSLTQNLILDLRGNGGGIMQKYMAGFLTDSSYKYETTMYMGKEKPNEYYKFKFNSQRISVAITRFLYTHFAKYNQIQYVSPHKNRFSGKLYVLTNGFTFSAAANLATNLKHYSNAILVGEETGGSYLLCSSGNLVLELPNSKLRMTINPLKFVNSVALQEHKGGVLPTFEVKPSDFWDDKNDIQLNFVKDLIKSSQK